MSFDMFLSAQELSRGPVSYLKRSSHLRCELYLFEQSQYLGVLNAHLSSYNITGSLTHAACFRLPVMLYEDK